MTAAGSTVLLVLALLASRCWFSHGWRFYLTTVDVLNQDVLKQLTAMSTIDCTIQCTRFTSCNAIVFDDSSKMCHLQRLDITDGGHGIFRDTIWINEQLKRDKDKSRTRVYRRPESIRIRNLPSNVPIIGLTKLVYRHRLKIFVIVYSQNRVQLVALNKRDKRGRDQVTFIINFRPTLIGQVGPSRIGVTAGHRSMALLKLVSSTGVKMTNFRTQSTICSMSPYGSHFFIASDCDSRNLIILDFHGKRQTVIKEPHTKYMGVMPYRRRLFSARMFDIMNTTTGYLNVMYGLSMSPVSEVPTSFLANAVTTDELSSILLIDNDGHRVVKLDRKTSTVVEMDASLSIMNDSLIYHKGFVYVAVQTGDYNNYIYAYRIN